MNSLSSLKPSKINNNQRIIRLPNLTQSETQKKKKRLAQSAAEKDIRNEKNELKSIIQCKMGKNFTKNTKNMTKLSDHVISLREIVIPTKIPFKRTKFRKTKFKIPRNLNNVPIMQNVICEFINKHKNLKNSEIASNKDYDKNAPFIYGSLDFVDEILKDHNIIKEKFGYENGNLNKNHLVLEKVLLTRLSKREENLKKLTK